MTRRARIFTIGAVSLAGLALTFVIAALIVLRTDWFREYVREKIISALEDSTGGKVELRSFRFDRRGLTAEADGFVIHGTEPPGSPPLFEARSIVLRLKLLTGVKKAIDLEYLGLDQPSANILVLPNGQTNIPTPKAARQTSGRPASTTVVDLAIHQVEVHNGTVRFLDQSHSFSARGQNLKVGLTFESAAARYQGELSMSPIFAASGSRPPLTARVTIPVTLESDKVQVTNARIETAASSLVVSGVLEHLASPEVSGELDAHLALNELARSVDLPIHPKPGSGPQALDAAIAVRSDRNLVQLRNARFALGRTHLQASGDLRNSSGETAVDLRGSLSLEELGQLFGTPAAVAENVQVAGRIGLTGDFKTIAVSNLNLRAFGGELTTDARVENLSEFTAKSRLHGFQIQNLMTALGSRPLRYAGSISGTVEARGNLNAPGLTALRAGARLVIARSGSGVPVSGRISADFIGADNTVSLDHSQIALPNTQIDLEGQFGKQAQIRISSRNLNDFSPALARFSPVKQSPVALRGGAVTVVADLRGRLDAPEISGQATATNFSVGDRAFDRFAAAFHMSSSMASVANGVLARNNSLAQFSASIGLRNWSAEASAPLTANATVRDGDLADLLALAGQPGIRARGLLNADARISGTMGNPLGAAQVTILNGAAYDEPFQRLQIAVDLSDQLVNVKSAELAAGAARVEGQASFSHPRDSFKTGRIQLHLTSTQIQLSQFMSLQKQRPGLSGILTFTADAAGDLRNVQSKVEFVPSAVDADLSAGEVRDRGRNYGNLTAAVRTGGGAVTARIDSDFVGSKIQLTTRTQLDGSYATTGDAAIQGLPVERVLAIANLASQIPARGTLSATGHFTGTLDDPHASVTLDLTKAVIYGEPLDRLNAAINYENNQVGLSSARLGSPAGQVELNGSFSHPASDLHNGRINLHLATAGLDLQRVQSVQKNKPGLAGKLRLTADVSTDLHTENGQQQILPARFDVSGGATGIEWNGRTFGDATFQTETRGDMISLKLDSDLAKSSIHGTGQVRLQGEYPLEAKLSFGNVTYAGWAGLLGSQPQGRPAFDGLVEGEVSVSGPAARARTLQGDLRLSRVELSTVPANGSDKKTKAVKIQNQGPITAHFDSSVLRIQNARLAGQSTDLSFAGTVALDKRTPLDVTLNGQADLSLIKDFSPDVYSSGRAMLNSTVRGTLAKPLVNGRIQLQNASIESADWPNGISNANGEILLNGTNLEIRTLTAESGGGRLSLGGFVGFTGTTLSYNVRADATRVRARYAGVSAVANAALTLSGTSERSVLGGNVAIERIGYSQQSDIASILTGASTPPSAPTAPVGPIAGMRLNIRIQTAPDVRFQTTLAEGLEATANLNLRGTLYNPGMVGRINVTRGALLFFGNKYTINRGSVSFYEAARIEPVLDVDLDTSVNSVSVTLGVSGPIENLKLTYRSDPPLKFEEIVALLATGRTPADATIAAHQPATPDLSVGQMGESAILSQAIADPMANRLQRVFGVSQLKIDPTFSSGSPLPQARVTLQQQVTGAITFTYTQDLTQSNSEIIRVEWGLTPRFSAVATRDENGIFGVDFLYKKQFR